MEEGEEEEEEERERREARRRCLADFARWGRGGLLVGWVGFGGGWCGEGRWR